jgi:hypothetical protein
MSALDLVGCGRLDMPVLNLNTPETLPEVCQDRVGDGWRGVGRPSSG